MAALTSSAGFAELYTVTVAPRVPCSASDSTVSGRSVPAFSSTRKVYPLYEPGFPVSEGVMIIFDGLPEVSGGLSVCAGREVVTSCLPPGREALQDERSMTAASAKRRKYFFTFFILM